MRIQMNRLWMLYVQKIQLFILYHYFFLYWYLSLLFKSIVKKKKTSHIKISLFWRYNDYSVVIDVKRKFDLAWVSCEFNRRRTNSGKEKTEETIYIYYIYNPIYRLVDNNWNVYFLFWNLFYVKYTYLKIYLKNDMIKQSIPTC